MKLARVAGTVVSTINVPVFDERKLLLCDLLAPEGREAGGYLIAVDVVGAGVGETVLLMDEGNSARQILAAPEAPVRTLVVGIVDEVTLADETVAGRISKVRGGSAAKRQPNTRAGSGPRPRRATRSRP